MVDQTKQNSSWIDARSMSGMLMFVIAFGVLVYAVLRASNASFTHDESLSYLSYPHQTLSDILAHKEAYTNNHLLNTLGMKYSERLFGTSELVLRLPNLLALVMYMFYTALLVRALPAWTGLAMFTILISNAQLLELFTLARGYGLSFGFMLMAIYHLVTYLRSARFRDAVLFHAACMLAVLSNFTLLDLYAAALGLLALAGCFIWWMMPEYRPVLWRNVRLQTVLLALAVFGLWEPVRQVVTQNHFDFGGQQGFYHDTMRSVIYAAFPGLYVDEILLLFFQVLFTALMVLALALIVRMVIKKNIHFFYEQKVFVVVTCLLVLTCTVAIVQHWIFGADHLEARFAKFLLPLLALHVGLLLLAVTRQRGSKVVTVAFLLLAGISLKSFMNNSGYYRSEEWQYDMETKDMMKELLADHGRTTSGSPSIRIGNTWVFEPTINFYRVIWHVDELAPAHRNGPEWNEDYLYLDGSQRAKADTMKYKILRVFDRAGVCLYTRRVDGEAMNAPR